MVLFTTFSALSTHWPVTTKEISTYIYLPVSLESKVVQGTAMSYLIWVLSNEFSLWLTLSPPQVSKVSIIVVFHVNDAWWHD